MSQSCNKSTFKFWKFDFLLGASQLIELFLNFEGALPMNKLKLFVFLFVVSFLVLPVSGGMGPACGIMMGVHAAKAVKKHKEKKEENEAENKKLEKLRERYPQDVASYEEMLVTDPTAAKRKFAELVSRYKDDTGEDLDKTYAVKKREGLLKRVRNSVDGDSKDDKSDSSSGSSSGPGSRLGRLFDRLF